MTEYLRLKSGTLEGNGMTIPIRFGLVFYQNGVYHFDLYVTEEVKLISLYDREARNFFREFFTLNALTVENQKLTVTRLSTSSIPFDEDLIKMTCWGHLILRKDNYGLFQPENDPYRKQVFYIEFEGLKMQFTHHTEIIQLRDGQRQFDPNFFALDHSESCIAYNASEKVRGCYCKCIWTKKHNSDNMILAIHKQEGYQELLFDTYKSFRPELVSLLSLINGGEVRIRKEYIGYISAIGEPGSDEEITYSFSTTSEQPLNDYIPIRDLFSRGDNILNKFFIFCFDKFIELNKRFDFMSVIYYLSGAEKSRNLAQKFFIEIIALERLAYKCVEGLQFSQETWIEESQFSAIEKEIIEVLNKYRHHLGIAIEPITKKVQQLNIKKPNSGAYKFYKLIQEASIPVTPDIKHLIKVLRNKSIHSGDIGRGTEAFRNVQILDTLLRNIILNLIGYTGPRADPNRILKG